MTNTVRLILTGLCAVLALTLAAELVFTAPQGMSASTRLPTGQEQFRQATDKKVAGMVSEILKHPLFTPGREPPRPPVVKVEPPKLQGRLAGVVTLGDVREAVFTRPGGRPVSVKEGEVIDGWTMAKIETGKVTLTSSFGEQVVRPTSGSPDEVAPPVHRPAVKKTAPTRAPPKPAAQTQTVQPVPPAAQQQQLSQAAARAGLIGSR